VPSPLAVCFSNNLAIIININLPTTDQDMASRHRARFRSIQVISVAEVKGEAIRRQYIKQLLEPGLKFPLPHRIQRAPSRRFKSVFSGQRPTTF
jgi:large subunit ribosomal protein L18Ae